MTGYFKGRITGTEFKQFDMVKDHYVVKSLFEKNRVKAWQVVGIFIYLELYRGGSTLDMSNDV